MTSGGAAGRRFKNPPIAELALSVEFAEIPNLRTAHLGILWETFHREYPTLEEHPELPKISEILGLSGGGRVELRVTEGAPMPRLWFLDPTGTKLVQIQHDRVAFNYRRIPADAFYPSFEAVAASLKEIAAALTGFAARTLASEVVPTHCEMIYVDHFPISKDGRRPSTAGDLGAFLEFWNDPGPLPSLGAPEEAACVVRYPLKEPGNGHGRLTLQAQPGKRRADDVPVLVMQTLIQWGLVRQKWDAVWTDFDAAHKIAERAFLGVTRKEMLDLSGDRR